ncbi:MAG: hypothetical protein IPM48_12610 [Saprospiraceae bacterium]|nr:hypothetical protein [Saprospiraceae bacterium]
MNIKYVLIAVVLFSIGSCKPDQKVESKKPMVTNLPDNEGLKLSSNTMVKFAPIDKDFIELSNQQKPYLLITDSLWHFYFALSISEETPKKNIYEGHWLDLKDNGTYEKGIFGDKTDEGRYLYVPQNGTIELRSVKDSSSEWKVKVDPDAMLFVGTEKYGNNPWQIKFLRKSKLPVPSN